MKLLPDQKMNPKKRVPSRSTSESSSGSSSDSSSSSSSSSGSDSSSSSDSDSSSSQDASRSAQKQQQPTTETTSKKSAPVKSNQRKSTDSATTKSNTNKTEEKPTAKAPKQAQAKSQKNKTSLIYSSEDDDHQPTKTAILKPAPKRKTTAKPKNSATITPKQAPSNKPLPTKTSKPPTVSKNSSKAPTKSNTTKPTEKTDKNAKKKSIFSPENSSESDSPATSKLAAMKSQAKVVPSQKPRPKASPRTVEKPKPSEKVISKPVVKEETKKPSAIIKSKPAVSSATSASSESTDSSSSSDSDSSADSVKTQKKSTPSKKIQRPNSKLSKEIPITDSEGETTITTTTNAKTITRKLTRSASTRKSKHLMGKNTFSDTDSDTESTKRSLSRSPVKKAPIATKGKTKNSKRSDAKSRGNESSTIIEERKCPLEGCDSIGHLGGKQDKHFTVEACPIYHNLTSQTCKDQSVDRKKRDENRRKALESQKKSPRANPTFDQKQYLQKIKDIRSKFKPEIIEDTDKDKSREPDLSSIVPDYDLKLFRDSQALGSEKIEDDLKTLPYTKGTKYIEMGKFEMEVWYQSPYPEDYARLPKLYLCEYCLRYMKSQTILQRHVTKCVWRHPPGEEVYRKDKICVWEVDGKRYKQYCQNLCLLAKFFLDHKTLYYDVEPFLFYVMTMVDSEGCHTVGYFSKEKTSFLNYNVSCILTLPPYQRQGYGRLLIDFSYLLTRVENKIGSPEKPLSDLGLISYRSYWKDVLLAYLCARPGTQLSIKDISQETAINSYDIVSTLQALGMMKYWKGKHIVLKKQDVLDEYVERMKRRGPLMKEVDRQCLRWTPFVVPQPAAV